MRRSISCILLNFFSVWKFGLLYKLQRSLYGLKKSHRPCFEKFSHAILKSGLKRTETGHSVFHCPTSPKKCVYLIVYVDDIVVIRNDAAKIS